MTRTIATRVAFGLVSVIGALTIVFVISRLTGDPAVLMSPPGAPAEQIERTRVQLGLDQSILVQYVDFLSNAVRGGFGQSYYWREDVMALVGRHLQPTLVLAGSALIYALVIGISLGLVAAFRRGRPTDRILVGGAMLGQGVPSFWLGPVLILVFAVYLGWLPATGWQDGMSLVLPTIALGSFQLAVFFRMTRAAALDALGQDFVRLVRAKGVGDLRVALFHVLPNTALPLMTIAGLALGALVGGSVIVETIFSWPGIGNLMIRAVLTRDFPVVQAIALLFAIGYVVINTVIDILYVVVDPRLKAEAQQ